MDQRTVPTIRRHTGRSDVRETEAYRERSAVRHRIQRVFDEAGKDALDFHMIDPRRRHPGRVAFLHADIRRRERGLEGLERLVNHRGDLHRRELQIARFGKDHHLIDDVVRAPHRVAHLLQHHPAGLVRRGLAREKIRAHAQDRERVLHLVRHTDRKPRDGLRLFCLDEPLLRGLQLGVRLLEFGELALQQRLAAREIDIRLLQPVALLLERSLRDLQRRDVARHAARADDPAIRPGQRQLRRERPARVAVGHDLFLHLAVERNAGLHDALLVLVHLLRIGQREKIAVALSHGGVGAREVEEARHRRVHADEAALAILEINPVRDVLHEEPEKVPLLIGVVGFHGR